MKISDIQNQSDSSIPIVIGVTGHRDLVEPSLVRNSLIEVFSEIKREYPNSPISILSALAEGADRLVPKVAFDVCGQSASLVSVLPFSQDDYEQDFITEESKGEFRKYLSKSEIVHYLGSKNDVLESRDSGYLSAGKFIVEHSNILISIWDGKIAVDSNGKILTGGTSDIVDIALSRGVEESEDNLLNPDDTIPVIHVFSERINTKDGELHSHLNDLDVKNGKIIVHIPCGADLFTFTPNVSEKDWLCNSLNKFTHKFADVISNIDRFNKNIVSSINSEDFNNACNTSVSYLGFSKIFLSKLSDSSSALIKKYGIADTLAGKSQKRYWNVFHYIFFIAFSAALFAQIYGDLWEKKIFLAIYLLGLITAYLVYRMFIKKLKFDQQFYDYRALAEGMRVQIMWNLSGIQDNVSDYYLRSQRGELDWIRYAIKNWTLLKSNKNKSDIKESIREINNAWIIGQKEYYIKNIKSEKRKNKKGHICAWVLFSISIIFALTVLFGYNTNYYFGLYSEFIIGFGPFMFAVFKYYLEKRAWNEHAEAYSQQACLFSAAEFAMNNTSEDKKIKIIKQLGYEALRENGDWVLLLRKRPAEPIL